MVRDVVDRDAEFPRGAHDDAEIVEQVHLLGHVLHPRPKLAALAQKVVVEIDAQECRRFGVVRVGAGHESLTALSRLEKRRLAASEEP